MKTGIAVFLLLVGVTIAARLAYAPKAAPAPSHAIEVGAQVAARQYSRSIADDYFSSIQLMDYKVYGPNDLRIAKNLPVQHPHFVPYIDPQTNENRTYLEFYQNGR